MMDKKSGKDVNMLKKVRRRGILLLTIVLLSVTGIYAYAKYYSRSVSQGVAIASGVYLTANYAVNADKDNDEFFESIVSVGYAGGDYSFDFEVRNYENNLLFNESSVIIPYSVSFWLESEPQNAEYFVNYESGEQKQIPVGKENKVSYQFHSIAGGSAQANKYNVIIDALTAAEHTPVPIYVEVVTEPGAVLDKVLRGKMVLNTTVRSDTYIASQEFIVPDESAGAADKFSQIQELSEFTYEIRTVGAVVDDESMTEKLNLFWDPDILEIDEYDDSYLEWKEQTGKTAPLEAADGRYYITLDVMPYSACVVYFFRGEDFDSITNMADLHAAIQAEKYQTASADTE